MRALFRQGDMIALVSTHPGPRGVRPLATDCVVFACAFGGALAFALVADVAPGCAQTVAAPRFPPARDEIFVYPDALGNLAGEATRLLPRAFAPRPGSARSRPRAPRDEGVPRVGRGAPRPGVRQTC